MQIRILSTFPGMKKCKGNQPKLLKHVAHIIVDRVFLAQFSYSGKSLKNQRKMAFTERKNIVALLYSVAGKVDTAYEEDDMKLHLRDKILKYAAE